MKVTEAGPPSRGVGPDGLNQQQAPTHRSRVVRLGPGEDVVGAGAIALQNAIRMYLGIDTASVAGNKAIDWAAAKAAGCRYAIFRGTYVTWPDPTWKREADRARKHGITVGAYMFPVMDRNRPTPEEQVAAFARAVGPLSPGELPPILDVEYSGGIAKTGRTRAELLAWIRAAVAALKQTYGIPPMIYTSARIWDGRDPDSLDVDGLGVPVPELLACPLWLARYPFKSGIKAVLHPTHVSSIPLPPVPKAWIDASNVWIHQYQGNAIGFPGCSGAVDMNKFFDLVEGARGERVRWLQRILGISVDGQFGPLTRSAVIEFQKNHQLSPDGVVGPRTFARLCWANGVDAGARLDRVVGSGDQRDRRSAGEVVGAPQAAGEPGAIRSYGKLLLIGVAAAAALTAFGLIFEEGLGRAAALFRRPAPKSGRPGWLRRRGV